MSTKPQPVDAATLADKYVTLTPEQRREAAEWHMDSNGANHEEWRINYALTTEMNRLAELLELAAAHPEQPSAKRLIDALNRANAQAEKRQR